MKEPIEYTPGPWLVGAGRFLFDRHGTQIATLSKDDDFPEMNANANLIAAAPELFEANEAFIAWMENNAGPGEEEDRKEQELCDTAQAKARAALAKAKGGAP